MRGFMHDAGDGGKPVEKTPTTRTTAMSATGKEALPVKDNRRLETVTREMMNRALGDKFMIQPKSYNDELGARFFATKAFSVDLVLAGLRMLSVEEIGSLSLRALALREGAPAAVARRIDEMERSGIRVGDSLFARLVRKLSVKGDAELLSGLLTADQHPDTLEHRKEQKRLLKRHMKAGNWKQVRVTLAVLTELSTDPAEEWNIMFQILLSERDLSGAMRMLEQMRVADIRVSGKSVRRLLENVLPRRRPGYRAVSRTIWNERLTIVINILLQRVRSLRNVEPKIWREVLIRLAHARRWDDLEYLTIHLANIYTKPPYVAAASRVDRKEGQVYRPKPQSKDHPLNKIFSSEAIAAFIRWGFSSDLAVHPKRRVPLLPDAVPPFTRGLVLIKAIEARGVYVHLSSVQNAVRFKLRELYGHWWPASRDGRRERAWNPYSLAQMVRAIEGVYEGIFELHDKDAIQDGLMDDRLLLRQVLGPMKDMTASELLKDERKGRFKKGAVPVWQGVARIGARHRKMAVGAVLVKWRPRSWRLIQRTAPRSTMEQLRVENLPKEPHADLPSTRLQEESNESGAVPDIVESPGREDGEATVQVEEIPKEQDKLLERPPFYRLPIGQGKELSEETGVVLAPHGDGLPGVGDGLKDDGQPPKSPPFYRLPFLRRKQHPNAVTALPAPEREGPPRANDELKENAPHKISLVESTPAATEKAVAAEEPDGLNVQEVEKTLRGNEYLPEKPRSYPNHILRGQQRSKKAGVVRVTKLDEISVQQAGEKSKEEKKNDLVDGPHYYLLRVGRHAKQMKKIGVTPVMKPDGASLRAEEWLNDNNESLPKLPAFYRPQIIHRRRQSKKVGVIQAPRGKEGQSRADDKLKENGHDTRHSPHLDILSTLEEDD